MNNPIYIGGVAIIAILFLIRKFMGSTPANKPYRMGVNAILFSSMLGLLAYHFYERKMTLGMVMVGAGGLAIGKYLMDSEKSSGE